MHTFWRSKFNYCFTCIIVYVTNKTWTHKLYLCPSLHCYKYRTVDLLLRCYLTLNFDIVKSLFMNVLKQVPNPLVNSFFWFVLIAILKWNINFGFLVHCLFHLDLVYVLLLCCYVIIFSVLHFQNQAKTLISPQSENENGTELQIYRSKTLI